MRPEAGPIEFAYGRAHFYSNKKFDCSKILFVYLSKSNPWLFL